MHTIGKLVLTGLMTAYPNKVEGQDPAPLQIHELPALRTGFEETLKNLGVQITGTNPTLTPPAEAPNAVGLQATVKLGKKTH